MSSLITSSIIGKSTMVNFQGKLIIANKVDWQYSEKFGKGDDQIGSSYSIRRPIMTVATENNMAWNAGNASVAETKVVLTIDRTLTTPMAFNDSDLTLKVERFSSRFVDKAVAIMAAKLDAAIANAVSNCTSGTTNLDTGVVGASTGTINSAGYVVGSFASAITTDTIAQAKQVLQDKGCPDNALVGILSTQANRRLVQVPMGQFHPLMTVDDKYRKGAIGEFDGISFSVSTSLVAHTNGTNAGFTPAVPAATEGYATWVESCTMVVPTLTGTPNPGDAYTFAGVYVVNPFTKAITSTPFQVTVVQALSATQLVVTPAPILTGAYQNISATLNGKAATLVDNTSATGVESLIFHPEAIACACVSLSVPKKSSLDMVEQIEDEDVEGFKIRFLRGYDMVGASSAFGTSNPGFVSRFDIAWGVKTAQPEFIVRVRNN